MSVLETEDEDGLPWSINPEDQKERIRKIILFQKSVYSSSSSTSSLSSSSSSESSSSSSLSSSSFKGSSLLQLMKGGNTSLRRLFDMEHTSLATYFDEYSGSPMIKPIPLWGSDSDLEIYDIWSSIKIGLSYDSNSRRTNCASDGSFMDREMGHQMSRISDSKHKLTRKTSYRRMPRFGLLWHWRSRGSRIRLRLKRLRIMICGKVF